MRPNNPLVYLMPTIKVCAQTPCAHLLSLWKSIRETKGDCYRRGNISNYWNRGGGRQWSKESLRRKRRGISLIWTPNLVYQGGGRNEGGADSGGRIVSTRMGLVMFMLIYVYY